VDGKGEVCGRHWAMKQMHAMPLAERKEEGNTGWET
jgi:hypothetical protein